MPSGPDMARAQPQPAAQVQPWQHAQYQPYAPVYPAAPVAPVVAPKSGGLGVLLSFFIPGLGSLVNGSITTGVIILVCSFVAALLSLVLIGIPFYFGLWIWGMVDGYLSAQRWNQAHGIIS